MNQQPTRVAAGGIAVETTHGTQKRKTLAEFAPAMRVDTRAGSKDLIAPLRAAGVQVEECILPAGDVEIIGLGKDGTPTLIGVEVKTVQDALACMRSGRFAEQARKMEEAFEIKWLLVEGETRESPANGHLQVKNDKGSWFTMPGHITGQEYDAWLLSMVQSAGVLLWQTARKEDSVRWLRSLGVWWTAKDWDEHRAKLAVYQPPYPSNPFRPPTYAERIAFVLPHLGAKKAKTAADLFGSVQEMACAKVEDWTKLKGVGEKVAQDVVTALQKKGAR